MPVPSKRKNKGSAAIEFVLVSSFVIVPLILGLFTYGFAVIRAMQAVQMTRDVAHMYALGSDFSKQGVQNLLAQRLTQGLNLVANSGNVTGGTTGYGVVVLSTYQKLDAVQCGGCNNSGHIVVMRRIVVGNKTLYQTGYGAPTPSLIDPNSGNVKNYSADISARADNVTSLITLNNGEIAYLSESYFAAPDLAIPGLYGGLGAYSHSIF